MLPSVKDNQSDDYNSKAMYTEEDFKRNIFYYKCPEDKYYWNGIPSNNNLNTSESPLGVSRKTLLTARK